MEDFHLVRRVRQRGRVVVAPVGALTSQRRWKNVGPLRVILINQVLILGVLLGVDPECLARWYGGRE